jgi:uncharacterized protein
MSNIMPMDHYVTITLSDDKLTAFLHFANKEEEFHCSVAELEQVLESYSIRYGIQYEMLANIAQKPRDFFFKKTVIASGMAPVDGEDGDVQYLYDQDLKEKKPAEMVDGTVDHREVQRLANVRKGQLIATRTLAKEGSNGKAVTGETLFARRGKEAKVKLGKNVVTDPEQLSVYAAIDGIVVKTDREKLNVFPIYEVNGDVDYNIGNIDFVGTVLVRGNVLTGFRIKAEGDIRILGGVEGAELEAGGSIEIQAGILGHNKGLIKAGKNVKSSFIQDANVQASEDIIVSQSIMHSNIRAGRHVVCTGPKGLIVGGLIQAGEKVTARTIGNTMSTATAVEVGVLPELRNELMELRLQVKSLMDNIDKTDKALQLLDQMAAAGQLSSEKIGMRIKLGHTKKQAVEELNAAKERILEIEKSLEDTDKARVEIISTIYSGAKVVIGRYTRFIKDTQSRVVFKFSDGEISLIPMT